ncbi:MAG: hypothetical protein HUJ29_09550 [Gammaproteobacteria bacterium]|nr:hypothetical protein [Gammaproteobacteria bacterium]
MEDSARHLMFHAVIVLLAGLLAGIPYGKAILKNRSERHIAAWRLAHAALPMGAILLLVLSVLFSSLAVSQYVKWSISILFIVSAYGFMVALLLGPVVGYRGLTPEGPLSAKMVYLGNIMGAVASLVGTLVLLYAAWVSL